MAQTIASSYFVSVVNHHLPHQNKPQIGDQSLISYKLKYHIVGDIYHYTPYYSWVTHHCLLLKSLTYLCGLTLICKVLEFHVCCRPDKQTAPRAQNLSLVCSPEA